MKRRHIVCLLLVLALALAACGSKGGKETTAPAGASSVPAQTTSGTEGGQTGAQQEDEFVSTGDYWEDLREKWRREKNEGYVWTITIDDMTVVDAAGLAKVTYDLDLSCSHVGTERNGIYAGSLAMSFGADLSGLNALMSMMGGTASTNSADGWFRNDAFVMELLPYNADKEEGFIGSLDLKIDENGEAVPRTESNPYADAIVGQMMEGMGSGDEDFELESIPVSYWFDWDYHMTEGDMSQSYSVTGVMGIGSASGGMDASGEHISGSAVAHSPLGGVFTDRYDETFDAPFPYIIRVYETGQVVFELHLATGGPVVIKFYGTIDRIPVSETTVVKD